MKEKRTETLLFGPRREEDLEIERICLHSGSRFLQRRSSSLLWSFIRFLFLHHLFHFFFVLFFLLFFDMLFDFFLIFFQTFVVIDVVAVVGDGWLRWGRNRTGRGKRSGAASRFGRKYRIRNNPRRAQRTRGWCLDIRHSHRRCSH